MAAIAPPARRLDLVLRWSDMIIMAPTRTKMNAARCCAPAPPSSSPSVIRCPRRRRAQHDRRGNGASINRRDCAAKAAAVSPCSASARWSTGAELRTLRRHHRGHALRGPADGKLVLSICLSAPRPHHPVEENTISGSTRSGMVKPPRRPDCRCHAAHRRSRSLHRTRNARHCLTVFDSIYGSPASRGHDQALQVRANSRLQDGTLTVA